MESIGKEQNSKTAMSEAEEIERTESEISEEDDTFQDISFLLSHNISKEDINKLKSVGINTIKGLQMIMKKKLQELGFNNQKIDELREAASRICITSAFVTAAEVSDQRKQIFKLCTGSKQLDKLLGGGIEAMSITEVFGEFRTGKTQLAHTLCVTAQMPGINGYMGGKIIFIDTEHTFRPDRLRNIADRFNLDQKRVLENVLYARAYNSEHQQELINGVCAKLHEEAGIFKLLIIDSIMALFRVDFGRGEMADRQLRLAQMLSKLQKISEEYNIAVFMTNQITSDFSVSQTFGSITNSVGEISSAPSKPSGGNIIAHASTTRVSFRKSEGAVRIASLFDSPDLEENEARFIITAGGIDDIDE